MLRLPIKRLNSLSPSSESLAPSSDSFVNPTNAVTLPCTAVILSAILEFVIGFVVKLLQLMCTVIMHNSAEKNEVAELQPIIVFHGHHFVRHLGNCYRICIKLLQLMCIVIMHNSVKKNDVSVLINGWVTANYSVSQPPFCSPSWNL